MKNPDREEWQILDLFGNWVPAPSKAAAIGCVQDGTATALRRLASSDSGVKGEPEPVAWPANLNPRTLDLVQRFALALAKKLRLAEEKYGHTDGWLRDDWEAECRDHLYQHLEKGDPRDVAAYCAFMWHHGWITYRPEPVASKRPVAFRVRQHRLSNYYELYTDEKDAQFWADDRGVDYEGLYLVADRYLAPPADAGMRPTTEDILECISIELSVMAESWTGGPSGLANGDDVAEYLTGTVWTNLATAIDALTAPGATTKSDGGVSLNDVREALERSIRELEYNRANHYSPDITTINRLKSQVLQAITKSDGGGESRPANPGTGGRAPCIEQTTPATMPAQAGVAPGPSDPSSTRSDPNEQAYADLIASGGIFPEAYQQRETPMTDDQIKHMVDRFLMWKLPEHFSPDCGISFDQSYRSEHGPVGTNLFDAVQATAMVRHMLDGLPPSAVSSKGSSNG